MAWNKNHFSLIMDAISAARSTHGAATADAALDELTLRLAETFATLNDGFDTARFRAGAGCGNSATAADSQGSVPDSLAQAQRQWAIAVIDTQSVNDAEARRQEAFRNSAVAAAREVRRGRPLLELAAANREACADLLPSVPKGTLYVSGEAVSYHALTGELLSKPSVSRGPAVVPTDVQRLLRQVKWQRGTEVVRAVLREATNQQDAVAMLNAIVNDDPPAAQQPLAG